MTLLRDRLQQVGVVAITAVAGMGGVGKTELATQYARLHEKDYPGGICWLSARDSDLAASIVQFAQLVMNLQVPQQDFRDRVLSLTEQVGWCWQNWQPPDRLVLVVLDDVTELASCRELLPTNSRFRVLITTRLRNLDPNIQEIPLDVLSPEAALQLFTALVGERRVQRELETAQELCKWLGYLPLGLELVGRYVSKKPPHWTLGKMLQRLKAQRLEDEAIKRYEQQLQQTLSTAQRGVLAAFELSWQELDLSTQLVGELLSLFSQDIFVWEWVESATSLLNWDFSYVEKANEQLYERHLIQWVEDTEACYKIHPLIGEFLQAKLITSERADELKRAFAETVAGIAEKIPESPTQNLLLQLKSAIPHIAEAASNLNEYLGDENFINPFQGLVRFYEGQGFYTEAERFHKQCLVIAEKRFSTEHPYLATSLSNLASNYYIQGRYTEAEPLHKQALTMRRRLLGEEHLDVADSLNNLALLFKAQGKYSEVETLYQEALAMRRKVLGEEHLDVTDSLNNLALLYDSLGCSDEAELLFLQALETRKRILGINHPRVATSLNNLASCYYSQKRYKEAEEIYLQTLKLSKELLGEEHHDVATALNNLAQVYAEQRRYKEAEPLFTKALKIQKQILGEVHPDIATGLNNLASFYEDLGNLTTAESLYKQALKMRQNLLGNKHPDVAISLNNLAKFYSSQNQLNEAKPLYINALEIIKPLLGTDHPITAKIQSNLEELQSNMKNISNNI